MELTLNSPLPEEDWDTITDVDFDHTDNIFFKTKHGKRVEFVKRKKGRWNFIGDNMFECTCCGVLYTTQQLNGLRNYDTDPYAPKFCPNCGADMRGEQDE